MQRSEKYIPLPEVDSPKVTFNIPFPEFVETDQIGVNIRALQKLCRLGGIRNLNVTGHGGGETSSYMPMIVGRDRQGGAIAGKGGVLSSVSHFQVEHEAGRHVFPIPHGTIWTDATIDLNLDEIGHRINGEDKWERGARTTDAWSHYLNKSLKQGVSKAGFEHLVMGIGIFNLALWAGISSGSGLHAMSSDSTFEPGGRGFRPTSPGRIIQDVVLGNLIYGISNAVMYRHSYDEEGYRMSLFAGPEFDRAAILKIASQCTRLAKTMPNNK